MDRRSFIRNSVAFLVATRMSKSLPPDTSVAFTELALPFAPLSYEEIYNQLIEEFCRIYAIPIKYIKGTGNQNDQYLGIMAEEMTEYYDKMYKLHRMYIVEGR